MNHVCCLRKFKYTLSEDLFSDEFNLLRPVLWLTVCNQIECRLRRHFHQGLYCVIGINQAIEKKYIFGKYNQYPTIYTMDHPDSIVNNSMKNSIGLLRVNMNKFYFRV